MPVTAVFGCQWDGAWRIKKKEIASHSADTARVVRGESSRCGDLHFASRERLRSYLQGRVCSPFLRGRSVVVLQETAQALMADDAVAASRLNTNGENQDIPQALMVPLLVIMRDELANRPSQ